jgi:hypothetical protein
MFAENLNYEILTPSGWQDFRGVSKANNKRLFKLEFSNGQFIKATSGHFFFVSGEKTQVKNLKLGDNIDIVNGTTQLLSISEDIITDVYDLIEVGDKNHQFTLNDCFITKNCDEFAFVRPSIASEFWTSITPTLSTGGKAIITSTPNNDEDQFAQIWQGANKTEDDFGNKTDIGKNGYKAFRSYWDEHPERGPEYAEEMKAQLGEERFAREILCLGGDTLVHLRDQSGKIFSLSITQLVEYLR